MGERTVTTNNAVAATLLTSMDSAEEDGNAAVLFYTLNGQRITAVNLLFYFVQVRISRAQVYISI